MYVPRLRTSLGVLVTLLGCALGRPAPAGAAPTPTQVDRGQAASVEYHVMAGELAAGRQQPDVAANEFMKALDLAPDAKLAARTTQMALRADDARLAMRAAQRWLALEPSSLDAREVITRLALQDDDSATVLGQCQAIVRDHPGGEEDGFRYVALLLAREPGHAETALGVMTRLLAAHLQSAPAWQAQALLALHFGRNDLAESSARKAVSLDGQSSEAKLLLTSALVRKKQYDEADRIVDGLARSSPSEADLRIGYARLLIEADARAPAIAQLQKALKVDRHNDEARLLLGLMALDEHRLDDAEKQLKPLADGDGDRAGDAEYYLGRIAEARNRFDDALKHYQQVRSGNQVLDASMRRAIVLAKLGHLADARVILEQLRAQFPPLATRFYLAEGELLMNAEQYEDAVQLYEQAIEHAPDPAPLRYARALAYEKLGRIEPAEADLRAVLAEHPDNAQALNALGYMLVVHSDRYQEADQLLSRAIQLSPNEPAVIDSIGWLRFRQGRQSEALGLLKRAYAAFPDPEVAAHLGEALWTSGDHGAAKAVFDQALKSAPDNSALRDTMKRLMP